MVEFASGIRFEVAMTAVEIPSPGPVDLYITGELDLRPSPLPDYRQEMMAVHELAARMADKPDDVLPRFVDLAMEITGGASAGISLFEGGPAPGVFRWKFLRGLLSPFEEATTPRNFSPCGVTLDENGPVLSLHPERFYDWISDAGIVVPEVLLVPLHLRGADPSGTLWIVSEKVEHFTRSHARAMTELASFVSIALRMRDAEHRLQTALGEQELLAQEMSHRVKNLFAITDGMIRAGVRAAPDTATFAEDLSGRLHALANAHALVSRNLREVGSKPRTGDIGALVRAVVEPHQDGSRAPPRIRIDGPKTPCGDHAINAIALIFHELTTNAAKYGALSRATGFVEASWRHKGDELELDWIEHGGPPLAGPPTSISFGSTLVGNTVRSQLGGSLAYDWERDGLRVTMTIPMSTLTG
jgi:two-component sensor histidine kinase